MICSAHTKAALVAALMTLGVVGTIQPAVAAGQQTTAASSTTSTPSSAVAAADRQFAMKAGQGGIAEVELGKLAQTNAENQQVKSFADRMVKDHSAANDKLKQIASTNGIQLPTKMDADSEKMLNKLKSLKGAQFDSEYMTHMVSDHKKDIAEFEQEAKSGHAEFKQFASDTLPTLKEHLSQAESAKTAAMNEAHGATTEKHASNQMMGQKK
jgi:putative membrane protein